MDLDKLQLVLSLLAERECRMQKKYFLFIANGGPIFLTKHSESDGCHNVDQFNSLSG